RRTDKLPDKNSVDYAGGGNRQQAQNGWNGKAEKSGNNRTVEDVIVGVASLHLVSIFKEVGSGIAEC
ncbi:hypothetical protein, partial [Methylophaga sp. UBA4204]|uniref:hypothetical protein n=1 Tax=Methylophaga sp. UBA4204 TaxID=1946892 RepID=UPI0025F0A530